MNQALDLYASFEPMIPFKKETSFLHGLFIAKLREINAKSVLDIGCGSGAFLTRLKPFGFIAKGIDISGAMVEKAKKRGAEAEKIDLKDAKDFYDALSAIFDMVNYLKNDELIDFFRAARDRLKPNGAFIFDINSRYGFESAIGDLIVEKKDHLATVRADFKGGELVSRFSLFDRAEGEKYTRFDWQITQYFHSQATIEEALKIAGFGAIETEALYLYGGEKADKILLTARV
jgi:SAM-dependent methyltransferase